MRVLAFKLVSDHTMSMAVVVWVVLEDLLVGCIADRRKALLCVTAVVLSETPAVTWWRSDQRERGCMTGFGPSLATGTRRIVHSPRPNGHVKHISGWPDVHRLSAAADGPTCDPSQRSRFAPIHIGFSTVQRRYRRRCTMRIGQTTIRAPTRRSRSEVPDADFRYDHTGC